MRTFFLTKESAMPSAQTTLPTVFSGTNTGWEGSLYAFLAEKQRRSGSNRTPDSYYRTLRHFFGSLHKSPDQVTPRRTSSPSPMASAFSGREPSPVTVGARLSCISSFFKFLIRMDVREGQSLRSRRAPQASSRRTKRPLRYPRCSNSSRSSPTPSRAGAT